MMNKIQKASMDNLFRGKREMSFKRIGINHAWFCPIFFLYMWIIDAVNEWLEIDIPVKQNLT